MSKLFNKYRIGTIFNPLDKNIDINGLKYRSVKILYPSRLNAMAIDPSKIAKNDNMVFTPGEIVFSVKIYKTVKVSTDNSGLITVSKNTMRKSLIRHAALLMKKAFRFKKGVYIEVDNSSEMKHCGLGSSSSLIASVACAINELYGKPIKAQELVKYLAQNHGEEIKGSNDMIQQVQCIGGSAASGLFSGGMSVITGGSQVIKTMMIPRKYKVVIGIPMDFQARDAYELMEKEEKNLPKFISTGKKFGKEIAYRILHELLPAMNEGNLKPVGDLIFDYRFGMGSIKNCSFVYPKMTTIAKYLSYLKRQQIVDVLSLSSVGPAFFAITTNTNECIFEFEKMGLKTFVAEVENNQYKVLERIPLQ